MRRGITTWLSQAPRRLTIVVCLDRARSIWNAFEASYRGDRTPFAFANHFETWEHWAYDHALARFVLRACRLPQVRCVSYRELADWLDVYRR